MKNFQKQIRTLLCMVSLIGFLATSVVCNAQDEQKLEIDPRTQRPLPAKVDKYSKQKFDVMLQKPMSVEDFVAYLREKTDEKVNIVVSKDARRVMVPPIELQQVSITSALEAMEVATQQEILWDDSVEEFILIERDPSLDDVYRHDPNKIVVRVVDVSKIVEQDEQAESSMLSAIEIGLEMANSSPENVNIKFHKETKLLFIRASNSDLETVGQVLEQIDRGRPKTVPELEEQLRQRKMLEEHRQQLRRPVRSGGH